MTIFNWPIGGGVVMFVVMSLLGLTCVTTVWLFILRGEINLVLLFPKHEEAQHGTTTYLMICSNAITF